MMFRPGSMAWLVAFDTRLSIGRLGHGMGPRAAGALMLAGFGLLHLLAWGVVAIVRAFELDPVHQLAVLSGAIVVLWSLALAGAIHYVTTLLFLRGDLDLLCSSPIPTRRIFTARALTAALQAWLILGAFSWPVADVAALYAGLHWLAVYPLTLAGALMAAAGGFLVTIALVRMLGPRRARTASLVMSALFGAAIFLAAESPALLGDRRSHALRLAMAAWLKTAPLARPDSWLWYPARAARGDWLPLLFALLVGMAGFALVAWLLPRGFLFAMQRAAGSPGAAVASPHRLRPALRFHHRFGVVVFLKEWRLILRDPWLLTQLGRRLIYLIPAIVIFMRALGASHAQPQRLALAGGAAFVVLVAGLLAGVISWIAVCAEELPDLLASAPRSRARLFREKMFAAIIPLWGLAAVPVAWFAWQRLVAGAWLLVCVLGVTVSMGVFYLALPLPASRTDLNRRLQRAHGMSLARQLMGALVYAGWATAAFGFYSGHWLLGAVAVVIALGGVYFAWQSGAQYRVRAGLTDG